MKIFGFNILTDYELNEIKNDLKKVIEEVFDKSDFYIVKKDSDLMPKCNFCDDDRMVEVELPDGTKRKVKCSCNKYVDNYKLSKLENCNLWKYKDGKIFISIENEYNYYPQNKNLIITTEQLNKVIDYKYFYFDSYVFASETLAKQAITLRKAIENEFKAENEKIRLRFKNENINK